MFLRGPQHYSDRPERVEVIETHFAWVFLTRRYAYKMKKPMQQARMDYRTLARRQRGCRNEIRLNRRLAPSVYLGVVPLSRTREGELRIGRGQEAVDSLVKMRRLPAVRMLDRVIERRAVRAVDLESLMAVLAAFFRKARRWPMSGRVYQDRLRARILQNAKELRAHDLRLNRRRIDAVIRVQLEFLVRASDALATRGDRLIEGHGDLRPEHVWLGPPPCVIDCLEFDRDLRRLDPAEEMAFLALECTRLGAPDVAASLLQRYRRAMRDRVPEALVHFYMSRLASTRAQIAAWHVRDPQFPRRRPWIARANIYLADALRYGRLALGGFEEGRASSVVRAERPPLQQRSDRLARQHAPQRLTEERRDRKRDELARCSD
jgi:aminoglycoside phosphotransferase family enzyme